MARLGAQASAAVNTLATETAPLVGFRTRRASTARSDSSRCPMTSKAELVESTEHGQVTTGELGKAGSVGDVGAFPDGERENVHPRLAPPPTPAPTRQTVAPPRAR